MADRSPPASLSVTGLSLTWRPTAASARRPAGHEQARLPPNVHGRIAPERLRSEQAPLPLGAVQLGLNLRQS